MARNTGYLTAKKTKDSDECYTPDYAVLPLLEYVSRDSTIWCPFDTEKSAFVKILRKHGCKVIATHISDKQNHDFLQFSPNPNDYDIIISNPPYSIKDKVIEKCYQLNKPFMLLLPLPALQGKGRFNNFINGLELMVFDGRISYYANGHTEHVQEGNSFASCYFCRDILPEKLIFKKLEVYKTILDKKTDISMVDWRKVTRNIRKELLN